MWSIGTPIDGVAPDTSVTGVISQEQFREKARGHRRENADTHHAILGTPDRPDILRGMANLAGRGIRTAVPRKSASRPHRSE